MDLIFKYLSFTLLLHHDYPKGQDHPLKTLKLHPRGGFSGY